MERRLLRDVDLSIELPDLILLKQIPKHRTSAAILPHRGDGVRI
jgi:hypothetical protein